MLITLQQKSLQESARSWDNCSFYSVPEVILSSLHNHTVITVKNIHRGHFLSDKDLTDAETSVPRLQNYKHTQSVRLFIPSIILKNCNITHSFPRTHSL